MRAWGGPRAWEGYLPVGWWRYQGTRWNRRWKTSPLHSHCSQEMETWADPQEASCGGWQRHASSEAWAWPQLCPWLCECGQPVSSLALGAKFQLIYIKSTISYWTRPLPSSLCNKPDFTEFMNWMVLPSSLQRRKNMGVDVKSVDSGAKLPGFKCQPHTY